MKEIRLNQYKSILLISSEFPPGPGGIGNVGYNLANQLQLNGIKTKVLTISDYVEKVDEEIFDAKVNFDIVRFRRYKSRIKTYRKRIKKILQTLKKEDFTHIIFSGRFSLLTSLLLRKYRRNISFIAIGHGAEINSSFTVEKKLIDKALREMDLIIPVSNFTRSKLSPSIPGEKIVVIPNGFDIENINEIKIKERSEGSGSSLGLVTVGTVWPRKGQHNVINALPKIMESFDKVTYNVIGRPVDLSKIDKNIEKKYSENIKLHGPLPNEEMYKILNDSDIFLMLSESRSDGDFEGFGIAVIEANYFGLPAIGSKNSGIEDAINNGVSGIIVNPGDPDEISEAVKTIMKNYSRFSEGARQWAIQHHWSNIIKRYIKAIDLITDKDKP